MTAAAAIAVQQPTAWARADAPPPGYMPTREALRRMRNAAEQGAARSRHALKMALYRAGQAAATGAFPPVQVNGTLWFHPSTHPALAALPLKVVHADALKNLHADARARVVAKSNAVRAWFEFARSNARRLGLKAARERFVQANAAAFAYQRGGETVTLTLSVASLGRWERAYHKGGVDSLIDTRGGSRGDALTDDAVAAYWSLRCDPRRLSIRTCFKEVSALAEKHGWRWHANAKTCSNWDAARRAAGDSLTRGLALNHLGDLRFKATCGSYLQPETDSFEPGECWHGDDSTLNVWVRLRDGRVVRPVLSCWSDWRSRCATGISVNVHGSADSLLPAFKAGVERFGAPKRVIIDNGKTFRAIAWTGGKVRQQQRKAAAADEARVRGIYELCGVEVSFCEPYSPDGKGRLERFFRTLDEQFCKLWPSYTGGKPDLRPESHRELVEKAVDFDEFVAALDRWIEDVYHQQPHTGDGMEGRTPLDVMALAPTKRVMPEGVARWAFRIWKPGRIGRQGVTINIRGERRDYGALDPALRALPIKAPVQIGYDPLDVRTVAVMHVDGRVITEAELNPRMDRSVTSEEVAARMRDRKAERKLLRQQRRIGERWLIGDVDERITAQARHAKKVAKPAADAGPGPTLTPVRTPIQAEPAQLRRAVGAAASAESMNVLADLERRRREFLAQKQPESAAHAAYFELQERMRAAAERDREEQQAKASAG